MDNTLLTFSHTIVHCLFGTWQQSCKKAAGMRVPPVRKVYHISEEGLMWDTVLVHYEINHATITSQ